MRTMIWNTLHANQQQQLLQRPLCAASTQIREQTLAIIEKVKQNGDAALHEFTAKFDKVQLKTLCVSSAEIQAAKTLITAERQRAIELAMQQITRYHQAQLPQPLSVTTLPGVTCQRVPKPIRRVGLYVPGGSAPLVSTVMMLAIPAKIANCPLRVLVTPPGKNGNIDSHILFAADLCGIHNIFKVGGAQAIAALAYGTASIPKVDKVFGPGNAWVTQAKTLVMQDANANISYDLPAGPSELVVIADSSANAQFVAADLLSQAEHGPDSQVLLITTSVQLAEQVNQEINSQLTILPRQAIAKQALAHSVIIVVDTLEQALELSNRYAPEHLTLNVAQPEHWATYVECAGAVFIGPWSAETLGDYITGSNHVLPTYGHARSVSGLCVSDFMTFINMQTVNRAGLKAIGDSAATLADIEGLHAHQRAATLRLANIDETDVIGDAPPQSH